jgi:hypothetical protein
MSDEKRYTLAEATQVLLRDACNVAGHRPDTFVYRSDGEPRYGLCDCGDYRWTPEGRK